jgi:hypothetical protein
MSDDHAPSGYYPYWEEDDFEFPITTNFHYNITKAKLGDKFFESEYGQTIYGEVISEPKTEGEYLSFEAKMSDGRTVTYGGSLSNSAYWPTIYKIDKWPRRYEQGTDLLTECPDTNTELHQRRNGGPRKRKERGTTK